MDRILFAIFTHEDKRQGIATPFPLTHNNCKPPPRAACTVGRYCLSVHDLEVGTSEVSTKT